MRVVVLGATGNFGSRISRALAVVPGIQLVLAARDAEDTRALAKVLQCDAAQLDVRSTRLEAKLVALQPGLVIHAAGPFQGQGYEVARAAAAAGSHYIDLADGRRFVADFARHMNQAFVQAGRCGVAGASTVPALSSAVVDALQGRFAALHAIDTCIAPAQKAPRGVATLAGVLSYCGATLQVWRDGRWQGERGWADPQPVQFARLKPRLGALCDIPDLELFPERYPGVQEVMFRAALEVGVTQRAFQFIAWLRAIGLVRRPERWARLLDATAPFFDRFGTDDGGMVVRLRGRDAAGHPQQVAWHVTAPKQYGPEIPCMASVLLAKRLARGDTWAAGARPCMGLLRLDDFAPEFRRWEMVTQVQQEPPEPAPR